MCPQNIKILPLDAIFGPFNHILILFLYPLKKVFLIVLVGDVDDIFCMILIDMIHTNDLVSLFHKKSFNKAKILIFMSCNYLAESPNKLNKRWS